MMKKLRDLFFTPAFQEVAKFLLVLFSVLAVYVVSGIVLAFMGIHITRDELYREIGLNVLTTVTIWYFITAVRFGWRTGTKNQLDKQQALEEEIKILQSKLDRVLEKLD